MISKDKIQQMFMQLQDKIDKAKAENAPWDNVVISRTFIQYEMLAYILEVNIDSLEMNYKLP
jgi:hypothetical protein